MPVVFSPVMLDECSVDGPVGRSLSLLSVFSPMMLVCSDDNPVGRVLEVIEECRPVADVIGVDVKKVVKLPVGKTCDEVDS